MRSRVTVRVGRAEDGRRVVEFDVDGISGLVAIRKLVGQPAQVAVDVYRTAPGVVVTGPGALDQGTVDRVLRAFGTSYDPEAPSHRAAMQRLLAGQPCALTGSRTTRVVRAACSRCSTWASPATPC